MHREWAVAILAVALVATAGCTGVFDSETGEIVVDVEEGPQGQLFVYVQSTGGQLPAGTEIAVEHGLSGVENVSGTLDRPANEGTKVYLGGPLGSESVTDFRYGVAPNNGVVPDGVDAVVRVTVDTGERTTSERLYLPE